MDGRELMDHYAKTQTVDSELAFIEMKTFDSESPSKDVVKRRFLALTKKKPEGGFDYLIRLVRPKDVEGLSVLTNVSGDDSVDQFLYFPAQEKPVKLAGVNRSGAFLGSDFAYEDLIREAPNRNSYQRLPDGVAQGEVCAVVRANPEKSAESQYAYRDIYVDPTSFEVRKIVFYNDDDERIKELQAYEYRSPDVDGKTVRPRFAVMSNLDRDTITVFKVLKSRLNLDIDEQLFSEDYLNQISAAEVNGLLAEIDEVEIVQQ